MGSPHARQVYCSVRKGSQCHFLGRRIWTVIGRWRRDDKTRERMYERIKNGLDLAILGELQWPRVVILYWDLQLQKEWREDSVRSATDARRRGGISSVSPLSRTDMANFRAICFTFVLHLINVFQPGNISRYRNLKKARLT